MSQLFDSRKGCAGSTGMRSAKGGWKRACETNLKPGLKNVGDDSGRSTLIIQERRPLGPQQRLFKLHAVEWLRRSWLTVCTLAAARVGEAKGVGHELPAKSSPDSRPLQPVQSSPPSPASYPARIGKAASNLNNLAHSSVNIARVPKVGLAIAVDSTLWSDAHNVADAMYRLGRRLAALFCVRRSAKLKIYVNVETERELAVRRPAVAPPPRAVQKHSVVHTDITRAEIATVHARRRDTERPLFIIRG